MIKEEAVDKDSSNYVENSTNCGSRTRTSRGKVFTVLFKLNMNMAIADSFAQYFDGN